MRHSPQSAWTPCFACRPSSLTSRTAPLAKGAAARLVTSELVTALLPVLDDIDAARKHGDLQEGPFASIATKLEELLGKQGVERFGE